MSSVLLVALMLMMDLGVLSVFNGVDGGGGWRDGDVDDATGYVLVAGEIGVKVFFSDEVAASE